MPLEQEAPLENETMALWRAAQSLSLADPFDLALNLEALTESRDYLDTAIRLGQHARREAA